MEQWKDYKVTIKRKSNDIDRFASPILFKPLYIDGVWYVFLLHREIPQKFKDATFNVKAKEHSIIMKSFEQFSMSDYMNYILNIDDYIQYAETSNRAANKRLDRIIANLEELKENYKKI